MILNEDKQKASINGNGKKGSRNSFVPNTTGRGLDGAARLAENLSMSDNYTKLVLKMLEVEPRCGKVVM